MSSRPPIFRGECDHAIPGYYESHLWEWAAGFRIPLLPEDLVNRDLAERIEKAKWLSRPLPMFSGYSVMAPAVFGQSVGAISGLLNRSVHFRYGDGE